MKLQHVHLRIGDSGTQKALPCRIRCTDAQGRHFAPLGRLVDFDPHSVRDVGGNLALGHDDERWAYIDGACEILLPVGELRIQASHGLEYEPLDARVTLIAGKLSLRLTMKRWTTREGWRSADTRVLNMSPQAALLEAMAEDVRIANVLAYQIEEPDAAGTARPMLPGLLAFSGQTFALESEGHGVAVNTWNRAEIGSLGLLHCHRVVHPLRIGGDDIDWTLDDLVDQCHRKKGLAVWSDVPLEVEGFRFGEPLLPAILGKVDAFEMSAREETRADRLDLWYTLLGAGIAIPLVGTGAKRDATGVLGGLRTMTQTAGTTYSSWVDACLFGKTYITNGPFLDFTIDGKSPHVHACNLTRPAPIRAKAESVISFDRLEVVHNGNVIASASASQTIPFAASVELETPVDAQGWYVARCVGSRFAHTSPIFVVEEPSSPTVRAGAAVAQVEREHRLFEQWIESEEKSGRPRDRLRELLGRAGKVWFKTR